ncbi:TonB-dependent receptor domain-containing protein [Allomuricauda sp. SCSIO 65647]|uniref:TonB-dependent receptor n=1 Tax=Allomuricauda sp. SCSIO 65647 TaxID=2908843 RepID=UPI001F2D7645|nr:TonB-dependent receptor [Muricauda sp. SCSIO 65647]UJH67201.1 TonB-dependent receptor [Muricauda sp. SCSIO 65647]
MKLLLFTMLCIGIPYFVIAQSCDRTLTGMVIDYHDKTPLTGASITVTGKNISVLSDNNGNYVIKGLCEGSYELEVSHPECTTQFIPLQIEGDKTLDIKLEHHLEELEEVKVVGDAVYDKTNSAQEVSLNTKALEQFSAASLGDALRELGGISTLNTGANIVKPAIHGLNGSRVLILNDGVRMQDMEWGDEHAPNVDINSAGTISVVKGASALQYGGDAIGGTIILEQQRFPPKDTLFGKTLLNGVSNGRGGSIASEMTKVYDGGFFIKGQGSFKRLGDQEAPDYILSNTGIQEIGASAQFGKRLFEWGFAGKYSYYEAEIAILRASHIGNVDDLVRSINSGQPETIEDFTYDLNNPRQKVRHHLVKLDGYRRFEGLGKWSLQYDFQNNRRLEFDVRRGDRGDRASLDLELMTHTLSTDFKWDSKEFIQLHFGLMGRYQDNFANPDTGVRRLIPDYEKYDFGSFLIGEFKLRENWTLDAGVRYDFTRIDALKFYQTTRWEERGYDQDFPDLVIDDRGTQLLTNPVFDYNNISATVGFQYMASNDHKVKFNYALSQRAPNPSELFSDGLHHSAARIELGDIRIDSETSHKVMLSYDRSFRKWGFTFEPYANFINDFILLEPTGVELTIRGAFPVWGYRQTDARILGMDLFAYSDWSTHWRTEHVFSLVKGNDVDNDLALINIPAANFSNKLLFSKPEWKGLELSLQSQYVFRQNEVPPNIMVFSPEQQQDILLEINTPPDAYHILNFNSKLVFNLGKQLLTTSLTVNNLLNTNYREYLNRQRFFADDLGRNIILQLKLNY